MVADRGNTNAVVPTLRTRTNYQERGPMIALNTGKAGCASAIRLVFIAAAGADAVAGTASAAVSSTVWTIWKSMLVVVCLGHLADSGFGTTTRCTTNEWSTGRVRLSDFRRPTRVEDGRRQAHARADRAPGGSGPAALEHARRSRAA